MAGNRGYVELTPTFPQRTGPLTKKDPIGVAHHLPTSQAGQPRNFVISPNEDPTLHPQSFRRHEGFGGSAFLCGHLRSPNIHSLTACRSQCLCYEDYAEECVHLLFPDAQQLNHSTLRAFPIYWPLTPFRCPDGAQQHQPLICEPEPHEPMAPKKVSNEILIFNRGKAKGKGNRGKLLQEIVKCCG
jgi:hypothetical protein